MSDVNSKIVPNTSDAQRIEAEQKVLKSLVDRHDALERLAKNRDFKKVILDGFLVDDAARNVKNSINIRMTAEHREAALHLAQAAGHLENYLESIAIAATTARKKLEESKAELEFIRQEEEI